MTEERSFIGAGQAIRMRMAAIDAPEVWNRSIRGYLILTLTVDGQERGRRAAVLYGIQRLATKSDLGENHLLPASETRRAVRSNGTFVVGLCIAPGIGTGSDSACLLTAEIPAMVVDWKPRN